jgi:hypothetical protein
MVRSIGAVAIVAAAITLSTATSAGAGEAVDQELVLAVDTSSSVAYHEYRLQMDGYAAAFRDPSLIRAIRDSAPRGIAVALVHWSSTDEQTVAVDWTRVHDTTSAAAFADRIAMTIRRFLTGQTDIAAAIDFAVRILDENGYEAARRTIDISGDGRSNQGRPPLEARDDAVSRGVTINGLAILSDVETLDRYYLDNVIGGPGAFSVSVADFEDFQGAVLLKLINEIRGNAIAEAAPDRADGG